MSLQLIGRLAAQAVAEGKKAPKKAAPAPQKAKPAKKEDAVDVTQDSKAAVEDLDDELKDKLAKEKAESLKK